MKESWEHFEKRVIARTGVALNDLPRRVAHDGDTMGHIMCARGSVFVCAVGYPTHTDEETGEEFFDRFELVIASASK